MEESMESRDSGVEGLPDDLTPFITRTTQDYVSGGAFGDIWKCSYSANSDSSTFVAVKSFRFLEHHNLEQINRKISREIGILKILRHDNIVPLLGTATGFGQMPESRCLVTPWIPNGTLNAYLASNHDVLTVVARSRMVKDVGAGLCYLHSVRVVHGDITGANILIDEGGRARLIDFGLSTIVQPLLGQSHLAATSIHPGAIRYAAPELIRSEDVRGLPLDKADIYSFGCVMLQILSGRHPWSEIISGKPEVRILVMISQGHRPQRPDGHPSIIDSDWDIIKRCLLRKPELRPSAKKVLDLVCTHAKPRAEPQTRPPNFKMGVGKSSLINLIAGKTLAKSAAVKGSRLGENRDMMLQILTRRCKLPKQDAVQLLRKIESDENW
jgi:serine/threonine protein kinase